MHWIAGGGVGDDFRVLFMFRWDHAAWARWDSWAI